MLVLIMTIFGMTAGELLTFFGLIGGFAAWIISIEARLVSLTKDIKRIELENNDRLKNLETDMNKNESKLESLEDKLDEKITSLDDKNCADHQIIIQKIDNFINILIAKFKLND